MKYHPITRGRYTQAAVVLVGLTAVGSGQEQPR